MYNDTVVCMVEDSKVVHVLVELEVENKCTQLFKVGAAPARGRVPYRYCTELRTRSTATVAFHRDIKDFPWRVIVVVVC